MLLLVVLILITSILNIFLVTLPEEIKIIEGKEQKLEFKFPMTLQLCCKEPFLVNGSYLNENLIINLKEPLILKSSVKGTYDFEFRLLGFIPLKKIKVHVLPETRVVPGGHSLGYSCRICICYRRKRPEASTGSGSRYTDWRHNCYGK